MSDHAHEPEGSRSERAERQALNLARHLNERYPDTVLFLARNAAGQPAAMAAELLAVDSDGVTLCIDGSAPAVRICFPATGSAEPTEARSRLRQLVQATRAAHPSEALTSLEEQLRGVRPAEPR